WDYAKVPLVIRNLGMHAATITSATLEFWSVASAGSPLSEPLAAAEGAVESGVPRTLDLVIPLRNIPARAQSGPNAGSGRVAFRVRYVVRGVTGADVPGCSREFNL